MIVSGFLRSVARLYPPQTYAILTKHTLLTMHAMAKLFASPETHAVRLW